MISMLDKTLIITHIDLDGSGVAILWKLIFPDADIHTDWSDRDDFV